MHWASCSHTCACIKLSATSRPYNLILTKWWWWTAAGKVTVGLASHWSRVTDSVIYPYGLNGPRKRGRRYYSRLLQQVDTRQVYVNIKTSQRWTAHSIYRRWTLAYIMIYRITYLSISRLITWWRHAGVWVTSCQAAALSCDCDIEEEDDDDDAMFMLMRHACSPASHCWAAAAAAARCWLALLLTLPPSLPHPVCICLAMALCDCVPASLVASDSSQTDVLFDSDTGRHSLDYALLTCKSLCVALYGFSKIKP